MVLACNVVEVVVGKSKGSLKSVNGSSHRGTIYLLLECIFSKGGFVEASMEVSSRLGVRPSSAELLPNIRFSRICWKHSRGIPFIPL